MENKNIVKKSGLYFIGNLSSKVLTSLLVPIYAFYITTSDLGQYDYSQTIMNIAVPIIFVSIWEAIIRFVLSENEINKRDVAIGTSCIFTIVMNLALLFISLLIGNSDVKIVIAMIIANSMAQVWQIYARSLRQNKIYVFSSLVGTLVNLTLNIYLICVLKLGLSALYISFIIGQISIFIILECCLKIRIYLSKGYFDKRVLKNMLIYSAPLVVNSIAMWLINGFGRTIIVNNVGLEANGLYSFANKFVNIISIVGSVISMAIVEEAMINLRKKGLDKSFPTTIETLFKVFQAVILVAMPLLVIFYELIGGTDYYISLHYIPIMMIYAIFLTMSTNLGIVFKILDKNKYQFTTTILGALVTVGATYLLLDNLGIFAVLIAQLAGALTMLGSRYIYINRYVSFKIKWVPIVFRFAIYIMLAYVSIISGMWLNIFYFLICSVFAVYDNRNFIKSLFVKNS